MARSSRTSSCAARLSARWATRRRAGDQQHVGGELEQPAAARPAPGWSRGGRPSDDHRAGEHRVRPAARPAQRAERHVRDAAARHSCEDGASRCGRPGGTGSARRRCRCPAGVPQLVEADVAQADAGDEPLVAGRTMAASWSSKRASTRPSPGRRRLTAASCSTRRLRRLSSIPSRSWSGSSYGQHPAVVVAPDGDLAHDRQLVAGRGTARRGSAR